VRPPTDTIAAPPFPARAEWLNSPPLSMWGLRGRPVLIEFWDFCRPNSLRTLPYVKAWHARYGAGGLVVIGAHTPGFRISASRENVRGAVERLGVSYPVLLDSEFTLWREYENTGWPARYLWNADGLLVDYHFGEGGYDETERTIQDLLGLDSEPLGAIRPEDEPTAMLVVPSEDRLDPPWSGAYEAGAAWAVLEPRQAGVTGRLTANGQEILVEHAGAFLLVAHEHHERAELAIELDENVVCEAICFTPGTARG
jgi:hypothetical protein